MTAVENFDMAGIDLVGSEEFNFDDILGKAMEENAIPYQVNC